jgi:hypothetical protein
MNLREIGSACSSSSQRVCIKTLLWWSTHIRAWVCTVWFPSSDNFSAWIKRIGRIYTCPSRIMPWFMEKVGRSSTECLWLRGVNIGIHSGSTFLTKGKLTGYRTVISKYSTLHHGRVIIVRMILLNKSLNRWFRWWCNFYPHLINSTLVWFISFFCML